MFKNFIFGSILLCSCTITRPIYSKEIPQSEVSQVIRFTVEYLQKDLEPGWQIVLLDGYIPNFFKDHQGVWQVALADGRTKRDEKIIEVFVYDRCLASSSLIHEIVHAIGYEHEDKLIWENVKFLYQDAVKQFCGEGYVKENPPPLHPDAMIYIENTLRRMNGIE